MGDSYELPVRLRWSARWATEGTDRPSAPNVSAGLRKEPAVLLLKAGRHHPDIAASLSGELAATLHRDRANGYCRRQVSAA